MVESHRSGGMAERSKAAVLKTAVGFPHRGFESLSLRLVCVTHNLNYGRIQTASEGSQAGLLA